MKCFEVTLQQQVWSVEWNITGTILASSGDDGLVRFWKRNYLNDWKCLLEVRADGDASQNAKRELKF
jgi:nucleoporin SEH1